VAILLDPLDSTTRFLLAFSSILDATSHHCFSPSAGPPCSVSEGSRACVSIWC